MRSLRYVTFIVVIYASAFTFKNHMSYIAVDALHLNITFLSSGWEPAAVTIQTSVNSLNGFLRLGLPVA
jgi:hypothetical protein